MQAPPVEIDSLALPICDLKFVSRVTAVLALTGFSTLSGSAQTSCSPEQTGPGVTICYPASEPSKPIGAIFHLSGQANAPAGLTVNRFWIALDGRRIYEERLATPSEHLSIEVNLRSPFVAGTHELQLVAPGAGQAELKGISFAPADFVDHCNPDIGGVTRTCFLMRLNEPLRWTGGNGVSFAGFLARFDRNLRALEADTADSVAVDAAGHLYAAFHSFSDIDLRKYDTNGSVIYDSVVRACGGGFTAVSALAVDKAGHAWIAANTDACYQTNEQPTPANGESAIGSRLRGLVLELDTTKPSSAPPVYLTFVKEPGEIGALRVDGAGAAYVAGATDAGAGFVSKIAANGAEQLWSVSLPANALPVALALNGTEGVFCAAARKDGRGDVLFRIPAAGGQPSVVSQFGSEGRVLATATTASAKLLSVARDKRGGVFLVAGNSPCRTSPVEETSAKALSEIAITPALDAFAASPDAATDCP